MKIRSINLKNKMSQYYIHLENTKKDMIIKEKYNYCSEECLVVDRIIKDSYQSYIGYGIFENQFHRENGIIYNISTDLDCDDKGQFFNKITYHISHLRKNNKETRVTYNFSYKITKYNYRVSLNKFIKDLFYSGIIAKLNN